LSRRVRFFLVVAGAVTLAAGIAAGIVGLPAGCQYRPATAAVTVLVFTRTAGFRHDSIPAGIRAIRELGDANGFAVEATEDAGAFTPAGLRRYRVVVFLNTTGDVLDPTQQAAFEGYIRAGNGFVGVHSASDTEYDWPFYGELVGAYFQSHPAVQPATIVVEDRSHPATAHLPERWSRVDEWYNFRSSVRGRAHVLARLEESSYTGGTMGADHPFAWCQSYAGGRSFYTAGGHTVESYAEPAFRDHLLGGIRYAAGLAPSGCWPPSPS
jgi:type 1 glutamine amidotransferase